MEFNVYEYTNKGGREYNEDSVGHKIKGNDGIFVVADGLGGHSYGELASAAVCDALLEDWEGSFGDDLCEWLKDHIGLANQHILELQAEKNTVLKSTVVALAIEDDKAAWANVGDSRLYYIHNDEICSITNDHSVAFKKYKAGEISRDDIRTDADQSCLLKSVGNADRNEPETYESSDAIVSGDAFMLCSDGVWEYISDEEVLIDLLKSEDAQKWAELLLLRLMNRINGDNDNLTIMTVMIS
jgi:serine/threonine protein phosphatase PrpC